jgi:hypothetical protein
VPDFKEHFAKFEEQITIGGYSHSTLFNYSRAVAKVSLHFKKSLLYLDPDEVNQWLFLLAKEKKASRNKTKELNLARKNLGQRPWIKANISWEQITKKRLNFNPNRCPSCKQNTLEVVAVILPMRGPPVKKIQANEDF